MSPCCLLSRLYMLHTSKLLFCRKSSYKSKESYWKTYIRNSNATWASINIQNSAFIVNNTDRKQINFVIKSRISQLSSQLNYTVKVFSSYPNLSQEFFHAQTLLQHNLMEKGRGMRLVRWPSMSINFIQFDRSCTHIYVLANFKEILVCIRD